MEIISLHLLLMISVLCMFPEDSLQISKLLASLELDKHKVIFKNWGTIMKMCD